MEFKGRLKVAGDGAEGIPVVLRLDDIYLELWAEGEELGIWRLDTVEVARLAGNEFLLDLDGEPMVFVAADPLGFAYEGLSYVEEISSKFKKKKRGKKKDEAPLLRGARLGRSSEPQPAPAPEPAIVAERMESLGSVGGFAARMAEAITQHVESEVAAPEERGRGIGAFFNPDAPAPQPEPRPWAPSTTVSAPVEDQVMNQAPAYDQELLYQTAPEQGRPSLDIPVQVEDGLIGVHPPQELTIEARPALVVDQPAPATPPPPVASTPPPPVVPDPQPVLEPQVVVVEETAAFSFGLDAYVEVVIPPAVETPRPTPQPPVVRPPSQPVEPPAAAPMAPPPEAQAAPPPVAPVPPPLAAPPVAERPVVSPPSPARQVEGGEPSDRSRQTTLPGPAPVRGTGWDTAPEASGVDSQAETPVGDAAPAVPENPPVKTGWESEADVPAKRLDHGESWFEQTVPSPKPVSVDDSTVDHSASWFVLPVDPDEDRWEKARLLREEESSKQSRFVAPEPLVEPAPPPPAEQPLVEAVSSPPPASPQPPVVEQQTTIGPESVEEAPDADRAETPRLGRSLAEVGQAAQSALAEALEQKLVPPPLPEPADLPGPAERLPGTPVAPAPEPVKGRHVNGGKRSRRSRRDKDGHIHTYDTARTVGGLTRRVCTECGHVSFDSEDVYQGWA